MVYRSGCWRNYTSSIAHPFHIHINPFQIIQIDTPTGQNTYSTYAPKNNFIWQDVIAVPPAIFTGTQITPGRVDDPSNLSRLHRNVRTSLPHPGARRQRHDATRTHRAVRRLPGKCQDNPPESSLRGHKLRQQLCQSQLIETEEEKQMLEKFSA
jgi:hypothetical protein